MTISKEDARDRKKALLVALKAEFNDQTSNLSLGISASAEHDFAVRVQGSDGVDEDKLIGDIDVRIRAIVPESNPDIRLISRITFQ